VTNRDHGRDDAAEALAEEIRLGDTEVIPAHPKAGGMTTSGSPVPSIS
jgi:hypothetical protein